MDTKVSVIVPVYNVEKYLCKCVQSLLDQTYKNIEIILVDDESTDRCPQICDEYAASYPQIRAIHIKNSGTSGARKHGLDQATGTKIAVAGNSIICPNHCIVTRFMTVSPKLNLKSLVNTEGGRPDGSVKGFVNNMGLSNPYNIIVCRHKSKLSACWR